jgi:outer membrane protein
MKLLSIIAAMILLSTGAVQAEDAPVIATVNIQKIMQESSAAKMVRDKLEDKQKSFQSELTKKDESLQKEEKEITGQKGVLSKEAFEAKARDFRKKVTDVQRDVQNKKVMLDNAHAKALAEIQKAVTTIVAELAKEKGFLLAIPMESPPTWQVLYADSKLDISDDVLARLNKKLPKVDVKFEMPDKK